MASATEASKSSIRRLSQFAGGKDDILNRITRFICALNIKHPGNYHR
jgi:hypothetical protein